MSKPMEGSVVWFAVLLIHLLFLRSSFAQASAGCTAMLDGNPKLPDANFSASSSYVDNRPQDSRLSTIPASSGRFESWASGSNTLGQYLQVDLGPVLAIAVAVRGRDDHDQWVQRFALSFSVSGLDWHSYNKEFIGNYDRRTILNYTLSRPQYTRFVRIYPLVWTAHMSLRWEVYGCPVTRPEKLTIEKTEANAVTLTWHHYPVMSGTELTRCYKGVVEHFNATVVREDNVCFDSRSAPHLTLAGLAPSTRYRFSLFLEAQGHTISDPAIVVITTVAEAVRRATPDVQLTCAQTSAVEDKLDKLLNIVVAVAAVGGLQLLGLVSLVVVLSCKHCRTAAHQNKACTNTDKMSAGGDHTLSYSGLTEKAGEVNSAAYDTMAQP